MSRAAMLFLALCCASCDVTDVRLAAAWAGFALLYGSLSFLWVGTAASMIRECWRAKDSFGTSLRGLGFFMIAAWIGIALMALACGVACNSSCAASGKVVVPHQSDVQQSGHRRAHESPAVASTGVALRSSAAADSVTLRWHAPTLGAVSGCAGTDTLRGRVTSVVLRLQGQAPAWRPGCERVVACWDSVRAQTVPDTLARLRTMPGAACSLRVAEGYEYALIAGNGMGWSCWAALRR